MFSLKLVSVIAKIYYKIHHKVSVAEEMTEKRVSEIENINTNYPT